MAEENTAAAATAATATTAATAATTATTATTADTKTAATTTAADTKTVTATTGQTADVKVTGATTGATDATQAKGYWPEDWLTRVTKGDQKLAKDLGRYASPDAVVDAYLNLRKRMDSGDVRTALPKDPKPEELAQWRKDNGIPEKPEGYDLRGLEVPEEDRDIVNGFLSKAHEKNLSPDQARATLEYYYNLQKENQEKQAQRDEEARTAALDALNQEWGQSFRRNVNLIEGTVLSKFPESVRDLIKHARLPDGTALFNSPDAIRGFAALALEINPAGIVAPGGNGNLGQSMIDEFNSIQKAKATDRKGYNANAALQERERDLIDAMIRNGVMDKNGQIQRKAA